MLVLPGSRRGEVRRHIGGVRRGDGGGGTQAPAPSRSCCRRCRIFVDEVTQATRDWPARAAHRRRCGGEMGRLPPGARGARRLGDGDARARRSPVFRPCSPIASRCSRRLIARALITTDMVGLANLILGEKAMPELLQRDAHAGAPRSTPRGRSSATRRSAGASARRWPGSTPSMEVGATTPSARAADHRARLGRRSGPVSSPDRAC